MKTLTFGMALFSLLAMVQSDLAAQEVVPGTEIRLVVTPSHDIRGSLLEWNAESLRLQDPKSGFIHVVPTLAIERLRVSEPRSRGRGALRGLVIGSIVGSLSLAALFATGETDCFMCFSSRGQAFVVGAGVGGVVGGGTGAAVGAVWPGTHWAEAIPSQQEDEAASPRTPPSPRRDP